MTHASAPTSDKNECAKFAALADHWWSPDGPMRTLHHINPTRLKFIAAQVPLNGAAVLDVGCGAGLLSEGLAKLGATVTGIDATTAVISAAKAHLDQEAPALAVAYHVATAEDWQAQTKQQYDVVICLECLEHVPDPERTVAALAALTKPGGHCILSTLNRTPKAFLLAIVFAEYMLALLPKGTHHYRQFIRPAELDRWARAANLHLQNMSGLHYQPLTQQARLTEDVAVNYLAHYQNAEGD